MESSDEGGVKIPLFPHYARYIGYVLILLGIISGYLYYFGGKPSFFETRVFAIVTAYLRTRYFVVIHTNLLDEMAAIFIVAGLGLVSFAKEKQENAGYGALRYRALVWAVYSSIGLWTLVFLLFYGYSIFFVAPLVFMGFFVFYNIFFRYYLRKGRS